MEIFPIISVLQDFSLIALPTVGYTVLLIIFTTLLRITTVLVTFILCLCALDTYFYSKIFPFIEEPYRKLFPRKYSLIFVLVHIGAKGVSFIY